MMKLVGFTRTSNAFLTHPPTRSIAGSLTYSLIRLCTNMMGLWQSYLRNTPTDNEGNEERAGPHLRQYVHCRKRERMRRTEDSRTPSHPLPLPTPAHPPWFASTQSQPLLPHLQKHPRKRFIILISQPPVDTGCQTTDPAHRCAD